MTCTLCARRAPANGRPRPRVGVCLMHMQGEPRTMQDGPEYQDVVAEVARFLLRERAACLEAGIAREAIALDPGLGFGKRLGAQLGVAQESAAHRCAWARRCWWACRARASSAAFSGGRLAERLAGGLGLAALAVSMGAPIIRTHDVAPTRDAIRMVECGVRRR